MLGNISNTEESMNYLLDLVRRMYKKFLCNLHCSALETKDRSSTLRYYNCQDYNIKFQVVYGGRNDKADVTIITDKLRVNTKPFMMLKGNSKNNAS